MAKQRETNIAERHLPNSRRLTGTQNVDMVECNPSRFTITCGDEPGDDRGVLVEMCEELCVG